MRRTPSLIAAFLPLLLTACSSPEEPQPDTSTDAGQDLPPPISPSEVEEALYEGEVTGDETTYATLGLWADGESRSGRLVVEDAAYELTLSPGGNTLAPIGDACPDCEPDAEWSVEIVDAAPELRLGIADGGDPDLGPGFGSLVMVPHDGFKPEIAPVDELQLWSVPVVAVDPDIDPPILDTFCHLGISTSLDTADRFDCDSESADSPWVAQVPTSWSTEGPVTFLVDSDGFRLAFVGELEASARTRFKGRIHRIEPGEAPEAADISTAIGTFDLTRQ